MTSRHKFDIERSDDFTELMFKGILNFQNRLIPPKDDSCWLSELGIQNISRRV